MISRKINTGFSASGEDVHVFCPRANQRSCFSRIYDLFHSELVRCPDWILKIQVLGLKACVHLVTFITCLLEVGTMVDWLAISDNEYGDRAVQPTLNTSVQRDRTPFATWPENLSVRRSMMSKTISSPCDPDARFSTSNQNRAPDPIASSNYYCEDWHRCDKKSLIHLQSPFHHA